MLAGAWLRTS